MNRRTFLFTASAAAVAAALPLPGGEIVETLHWIDEPNGPVLFRTADGDVYTAILKLHYMPVIVSILNEKSTLLAVDWGNPRWRTLTSGTG